jgi:hypothetical protein
MDYIFVDNDLIHFHLIISENIFYHEEMRRRRNTYYGIERRR